MRINLVAGTRPTNIKVAQVAPHLSSPLIISTSQHFSDELKYSYPLASHLEVPGRSLGDMTSALEDTFKQHRHPVVVFGDTRTALAGALAAKEVGLPIAHVEAGLRCGDKKMHEEQNRILIDELADINYSLMDLPDGSLGLTNWVRVGDCMYDAYLKHKPNPIKCGTYVTIHRREKFSDVPKLKWLVEKILDKCPKPIVWPMHPHTAQYITVEGSRPPMSYEDSINHVLGAELVVTDSGGVAREANFAKKPLVCLRNRSEFGYLTSGEFGESWSVYDWPLMYVNLGGVIRKQDLYISRFGDGHAGEKIAKHLEANLK